MVKLGAFIVYATVTYGVVFGAFYASGDLPAKTEDAEFWHRYGMIFWFIGVVCSWLSMPASTLSEYSGNGRCKNRQSNIKAPVGVEALKNQHDRQWKGVSELNRDKNTYLTFKEKAKLNKLEQADIDALIEENDRLRSAIHDLSELLRKNKIYGTGVTSKGSATLSPPAEQVAMKGFCPQCHTKTLIHRYTGSGMEFHQCSRCKDVMVLTANN